MSHEYTGELETHLTLDAAGVDFAALDRFAATHALKCLHIVLARGVQASQPMLTRRLRGTLSAALRDAAHMGELLRAEGWRVCRVKIEASPTNEDVPQEDGHGLGYFESHLKLRLSVRADVAALTAAAIRHGAHLSRNALRLRDDGDEERYVTQRCAGGWRSAQVALESLHIALASLGHMPLRCESEFVVYDSNLAVDDGWIEEEHTCPDS